jgi:2-polyprenyl-3-methyl-5-hydroxy-6-metoxy-1,4-benzoquinol methylase
MGVLDSRTIRKCAQCTHRFASAYNPHEISISYDELYYASPEDPRIDAWIMKNKGVWTGLCRDLTKVLPQTQTLLDVGAGTGGFLLEYARKNPAAMLFAMEQSENATKNLKARSGSISFIKGNAQHLNECNETFDAISFLQVLEHLPDPVSVLKHSREHLNHGGGVFMTVPNAISYRVLQKGIHDGYCFTNRTHLHFFTRKSMDRALRSAGFTDFKRIVSWGGSNSSDAIKIFQYLARHMGISTELRYIAYKP